jgi:putative transposase
LRELGFFENIFLEGLDQYDEKIGIDTHRLVGDCSHAKSPLGKDSVGPSPVDRRKQGTKRSIITDGNGIILGCFVGPGNKNDAKLLEQTIQTIPSRFKAGDQECWLDAGYDTTEVRTICFRYNLRHKISPNPRRKIKEPVRPLPKGVRWVVERSHSWINRFRRILIQFDKLTDNYLASIKFAVAISLFKRLGVSG